MSEGYYEDCEVRSWALDHAIQSNHRGAGADKIIKDAEKFYGFMFRENGSVADINDLKAARAVPQPVEDNAQDVFIPPAPVTPEDIELTDEAMREEVEHAPPVPEPATARSDIKKQLLSPRQKEVLQTIIELNREKQQATHKEISRRSGVTSNNISAFIKILSSKGFVEQKKPNIGRRLVCRALKDADGNPLLNGHPVGEKDAATGITKCQPGYADGYGISTLFEEE